MLECVYKNKVKERSTNSIMIISNSNVATNGSLMHEIETKSVYDDFSKKKKMFEFSNYSSTSKYYNNSNTSVVDKIKDEVAGVATEEFGRQKPKIYSILLSHSKNYRKGKWYS